MAGKAQVAGRPGRCARLAGARLAIVLAAPLAALGIGREARAQRAADAITPPAVLAHRDAEYPEDARRAGVGGMVVLTVTLSRDGAVQEVVVSQSAGKALDEAAVSAVRTWSFSPARRGTTPVASRIRVPFRFELPSASLPEPRAPVPSDTPEELPTFATAPQDTDSPDVVRVNGPPRRTPRSPSDFSVSLGAFSEEGFQNATDVARLAPGLVVTNEGGSEFGQHLYLRGFSADEGQDFELSVDGVPINESGNVDVNGFADPHFIIPEVVQGLHIEEGTFDPRQGNYAAAASLDYELGLARRGLGARYTLGSWGTDRLLVLWGPPHESAHTFAAAEVYKTDGFGQNRDAHRATAMTQYEGRMGEHGVYRLTAQAYVNQFHSAGELREDDVAAGRVGFYDTYDPRQGGQSSRYSAAATLETRGGAWTFRQQVFVVRRDMELRENFTGYLEDPQLPFESAHPQRGDLVDTSVGETTFGARGFGRLAGSALGGIQTIELGYFARGDLAEGTIQRIAAATDLPYRTDGSLDSALGDVGLYADAALRFGRFVTLRGGPRFDVLAFDVLDRCAVPDARSIPSSLWPNDASCLALDGSGHYRDPSARTLASTLAAMPRASLAVGPWKDFTLSVAYGTGGRSADPQSVADGTPPLFATVESYEAGVAYTRVSDAWKVDARSNFFRSYISQDTLFSETAGRTIPTQATSRTGWAGTLRLTGRFFDELGSLTLTRAIYEDTRLPVPFTPTSVLRSDTVFFGTVGRWAGHDLRVSAGTTVTFVGPRPLPYAQESNSIFTVDGAASAHWAEFDLEIGATNVLDSRYELGQYNYVSNWHPQGPVESSPERHFSAGAPRYLFVTVGVTLGDSP